MPKASAPISASSAALPFGSEAASVPGTQAQSLPATYEAAMAELERLVAQLESGDLPLDQLLSGYQRGAALLQHCRDKLQAVEDQIQVLDDGVLKPWKSA